jgi:ABC-type multidrug transport system ATPase subunit
MSPTAAEAKLPLDVCARDLRLVGPRGDVYGPVDLDVPAGWTMAVVGRQGSGRTSLLLTLAGRMRPTSGTLTVVGSDAIAHPRRVQRRCAVAGFATIDALDDGLRVREVVREQAEFSVPLWRRPLGLHSQGMAALIETVYGTAPFEPDAFIWQLSTLERSQLRVLLALIASPSLLVVDDVDAVRRPADQERLWRTLQRACATGCTVIAASSSAAAIPGDIRVTRIGDGAESTSTQPPEPESVTAPSVLV